MEIKETDTLLILSIIGLMLLGNVCLSVAAQFDSSHSRFHEFR